MKEKKKPSITPHIILSFTFLIASYLSQAFINIEMDFSKWGEGTRVFVLFSAFAANIFNWLAYYFKHEK